MGVFIDWFVHLIVDPPVRCLLSANWRIIDRSCFLFSLFQGGIVAILVTLIALLVIIAVVLILLKRRQEKRKQQEMAEVPQVSKLNLTMTTTNIFIEWFSSPLAPPILSSQPTHANILQLGIITSWAQMFEENYITPFCSNMAISG